MQRRTFLGLSMSLMAWGPAAVLSSPDGPRFLSCRSDPDGRHFACLFEADGSIIFDLQLPLRGHGATLSEDGSSAAVFSRRPGDLVWIIDLVEGRISHRITAPSHTHYYGHGVYSADGQWLMCCENRFESGEGVIGVYQVSADYRRIGEMASHGIGPHEIRRSADGDTLIVANGGILTHPDMPRRKLNLSSMRPNLSYLDSQRGTLLEQVAPPEPWHQLSIRHLSVSGDDRVALAMQYQGDPDHSPPLIGLHRRGERLQLLSAPAEVQSRLHNYCGSVAFSGDGSWFAVSAPRGGLVTYWSGSGAYLGLHEQADACGLAPHENGFLVSDGMGRLEQIGSNHEIRKSVPVAQARWDNHLLLCTTISGTSSSS
ncbi:MAG: DUF1513 domain-containing protein [Candidatus Thiodiazotropha sp.]